MPQSKLELAVGTGKWDAGLKKAQDTLNSFTRSQGGLQQALDKENQKMSEFVKMMGKMDSTANTAKGQMNDYKRVLEQLTAQYNLMSDAQKKGIGKDYLQSIDALKQKFMSAKQQVEEFNRSIGNIKTPDVSANIGGGGLFGNLSGTLKGGLQVFAGNLMTKVQEFAMTAASEMKDLVAESIEVAKATEGIRMAYDRLNQPYLMSQLKEATHGTVSELELMKQAVKFDNFKLPLEDLATYLAFAQQKAKDTGESIDYLVNSIVTGLGRQSKQILDNLGISASELTRRMNEGADMTKAVADIIREEMAKAGDYVETAADRAAKANADLENAMRQLGETMLPLADTGESVFNRIKLACIDALNKGVRPFIDAMTEAGRLRRALGLLNGGGDGQPSRVEKQVQQLQQYKDNGAPQLTLTAMANSQISEYNRQISERQKAINAWNAWRQGDRSADAVRNMEWARGNYGNDVTKINAEIQAIGKMRDEYKKSVKEILNPVEIKVETDLSEKNIDTLKKKLNELEAKRKKAVIAGDQDLVESLTKQINQTKANIGYLDPTQKNNKKSKEVYAEGSIGAFEKELQNLVKAQKKATSPEEWKSYQEQIRETTVRIKVLKGEMSAIGVGGLANAKGVTVATDKAFGTAQQKMKASEWVENRTEELQKGKLDFSGIDKQIAKIQKGGKDVAESWKTATSAVNTFGSVLGAIEDPAAKVAATVAQAIASVALAYAETLAKDQTTKSNVWAFIAAAAAATVSMATTIASIHSSTGYAEGGIIKGNHYSGDMIGGQLENGQLVGLNAQEVVLNRAQSGNLASQLQGGGVNNFQLETRVSGDDLRIILRRSNMKRGYGSRNLVL